MELPTKALHSRRVDTKGLTRCLRSESRRSSARTWRRQQRRRAKANPQARWLQSTPLRTATRTSVRPLCSSCLSHSADAKGLPGAQHRHAQAHRRQGAHLPWRLLLQSRTAALLSLTARRLRSRMSCAGSSRATLAVSLSSHRRVLARGACAASIRLNLSRSKSE